LSTAALAVLAVGVGVGVGVASAPAGASTAAGHRAARIAPALLPAFRVDVSRYPQVGLVVTVPAGGPSLTSSDFSVMVGTRTVQPSLRYLSPGDIQLVLAPAMGGTTALAEQGPAAASFLVNLPRGAQTGVVDPSRAEMLAGGLTTDPTTSVAGAVAPAGGAPEPAAARLTTALSAFSPGVQVRRTVVLVIGADETLSRAASWHFRQQLAAGGTALYVLDASPDGSAGFDALAAASGGFAARLRTPADWRTAFSQIITDLGQQYYLRFIDPVRLPGLALIAVTTPSGILHSVVQLPAANPVAPPPLSAVRRIAQTLRDWPLVGLGVLLIVLILCYGLGMLAASRRNPRRLTAARQRPARPGPPGGDLFFVFLLPCLNEEKVILNSLQRLLSMPRGNFAVLVIDDDSDDRTVEMVSSVLGERAWLLQRTAPDARQGKGEALNAAVSHLTASGLLDGRDPDNVIVVVVDADGRLDPHAVAEVTPYFSDPMVGAVQIGVRINNRTASRLARMQDMEFVIYTEVFQRGRRHLGSVGLGGNGQFMRLSALRSLGPAPWTRSLTEDLDLGIRLLANGWRNEYCSAAAVHQQGVVQLRRLIRQRSRWFQGHLQAWKLIPSVLRNAPRRARADLLYHLSSPAILLIASLLSASFLLAVANDALVALHGQDPFGWWLASTYALTFGPALVFSSVYWARERHSGVPMVKIAGFAHLYVCYSLMWYVAGWWAVGRTLRGRTSWTKTERVTEAPVMAPVLAAGPAASPALERMAAAGARPALGGVLTAPATSRPAEWPAPATGLLAASSPAGSGLLATSSPAPSPASSSVSAPAPAPPGPGAGRRGGRRRVRPFTVAAAVVLAWAVLAGTFTLSLGSGKQSQWYSVFNGYGVTTLAGSGARQVITLSPGRAQTRADTHAALVLTKAWYQDFSTVLQVRTVRQLRKGAAGSPNPWEVGWVVWHYTSNQRFYALTLEPTGWVLSKQDPSYKGGERFLASSTYPRFPVGVTHTVGIVQIGNQITVSADGHLLTQFTDAQRPYLGGGFGVYSEDSVARFSHIQLSPLRNASSPPVPMPAAQQKPAIPTGKATRPLNLPSTEGAIRK
jgi:cellulose synthase/poly-beta-1,6-N-acetylglucosamine synthase-like glycosyltransferase